MLFGARRASSDRRAARPLPRRSVTDLAAARWFSVDLRGLVVTAEEPDALYRRAFEEYLHHSLVLPRGETAACARLAYRVRSAAEVDRAEASSGSAHPRPPAERAEVGLRQAGDDLAAGHAGLLEQVVDLPRVVHHVVEEQRVLEQLRRQAEIGQ